MTKTPIHMFTSLSKPGLKLPFNLSAFSHALPVNSADVAGGTIIYPIGYAGQANGIFVKEALEVVTEAVVGWETYAANLKHGTA